MSIVPRFTRRQALRHAVAGGALLGGGLALPLVVAARARVAPAIVDQPASGSAALLRATADALRADAFLEPTDPHWGHAINQAYVRAAACGLRRRRDRLARRPVAGLRARLRPVAPGAT